MPSRRIARIALTTLCIAGCGANGVPQTSRDAAPNATAVAQQTTPVATAVAAQDILPGGNAQGAPISDPADAPKLQRQIIYDAQVRVVVEDFEGIPESVERLVVESGGFVASAQLRGRSGAPRTGEWKVRLPVGTYPGFLAAARKLGELQSLTATSQDVSDQYYDLEARIHNKQKEEARLLKHLEENTGKLDEILAVEREVSRVREELERMEGRMRVLRDLVALTTVTLHVDEIKGYVPPQTPTFALRISRAFYGSWTALVAAAQTLVVAGVVIGPWFGTIGIPILGIVAVLRRRIAATRHSAAPRS
jgi:hypothetical protein